ncbi:VOC family protein [Nodosilinea nodulosa]|uniref:VOC family protein n=1 Tax=Nodosilinea nodulosa TaxID=416001 RepID=UPI00037690DF|nr:VOC family protein [Nodosilinea nodulosa]
MKPQPLIVVQNVPKSSRWYQEVFGCTSAHGGEEYDQLEVDGRLVLQIHRWDVHEHPHLGASNDPSRGNGVLLWFEVDDFDASMARIRGAGAEIADGPLINPSANHRECWIRDPDGYMVVIAGPRGDLGGSP